MRAGIGIRQGIASLALCCTVAVLQAQAPAASPMEQQFQAAMAAQDKGDLVRAESLLLALHAHHPGLFAVEESLGLLYVAQEKYQQAIPFLQSAAQAQPSSDVAHANLGAAYYKLHRNPLALREFQTASRLNPRNAETQQALGRLWMEANNPASASTAFLAALQLKPDDPDLCMAAAQSLQDAGKSDAAKSVLAAMPGVDQSAPAQSLLGDIEEKLGNVQQAGKHYQRAVELDPSEPNVWMLGVELLRHWTFAAAAQEFEAAAKQFPQSRRMQLGLGAAYFGNGSYASAIPVFAGLLDADPNNALYAELLGMSCTAVMQEARPRCTSLQSYALAHPRDARAAVYASAQILQGSPTQQQLQLAHRMLQSAIDADPKLADARFQMGVLQQAQGDWPASIPSLQAALRLKPDLAAAHYRLALAYWRAGRKPEAQAEMKLQQKYYRQQQDDLDQRLRQITTFLVDVRH